MPDPIPAQDLPLTCEYCCNTLATQVFSADVLKLGRHTTFTCGPCGDEQEYHVRRLNGQVWRFRLAPLQEVQRVSDIPAQAIQAAAEALTLSFLRTSQLAETSTTPYSGMSFEQFATVALKAAAPVLAVQARAHERRKVAEEIRAIVDDSGPYPMNAWRAFKSRHKRLVTGDSIVAVMLAVADEIEGKARDSR